MLKKLAAGAAAMWLRKPENRAKAKSTGKDLMSRFGSGSSSSKGTRRRAR